MFPHQSLAVRVHRGVLANASIKHQNQKQLVEQPVIIVEEVPVPVVEVVVEGGLEPGVASLADPTHEPTLPDRVCTEQLMALRMNETRLSEAQSCEEKAAYTEQATAALKLADQAAALVAVESAYHRCMGLSQTCAKQVAPHLLTKVRFSGVAITQQCKTVAGAVKPGVDTNVCERNMTTGMVAELKQHNTDAVMLAAQHGLNSCYHVAHPCDFQLAPILVMQLIQSVMGQAQQQIAQVLLAGLSAAEDVSANLRAAGESNRKPAAGPSQLSSTGHQQKQQHQQPQEQTQTQKPVQSKQVEPDKHHKETHPKKLSLLSIDDNLVLTFQRRSMQL